VFLLDTLLIGSIRFVLEKVAAAAEAEVHDDSALREQLLEAEMKLELGELSDAEFAAIERDILERIREIKGAGRGALTMTARDQITGVEVETYHEDSR
jgi:hypothetical protein